MKTYKIHILRHGQTEANVRGICAGITDYPLTEDGKAEIAAIRETGVYPYAERYFCSPLARCRETIALMYPEASAEVIDDLHEHSFGIYEDKMFADLQYDEGFMSWVRDNNTEIPGGENAEQLLRRTSSAFDLIVKDIMSKGQTSAVIVTHGGVMMALLTAFGLPRRSAGDYIVGNGRGFTIRITPSVWMREGMFEVVSEIPEGDALTATGEQIRILREINAISQASGDNF